MKKTLLSIMMMLPGLFALGQSTVLTLEECHRQALQSNNSLKISQEKVAESDALKKMALCEMLPRFSANGTYNWNQKSIQLVGDEQAQTLSHMGSAVNSQLMGALTPVVQQIAATDPAMAQSLLGAIGAMDPAVLSRKPPICRGPQFHQGNHLLVARQIETDIDRRNARCRCGSESQSPRVQVVVCQSGINGPQFVQA